MRTPAKIPVHKTLEDCRELVFSHLVEVQDEYATKGWLPRRLNLNAGITRGLLEVFAWVLFSFYTFMARALKSAFPLEKDIEKDWLDLHASQILLQRRPATKAEGLVTFFRAEGVAGNIRIPAGRIVRTLPDGRGDVFRYITTADAVLLAADANIAVPVVAEEYGQGANATVGQICEISTHIPGIGSVSNGSGWLTSEGANEETNAQLQERYTLAWLEESGCTAAAYQSWALSIPGVVSVKILDQHPRGEGTVDIIVQGTAGIPTETLLVKVRKKIAEKAPVNDLWQVKSPVPKPVSVIITLEITSGIAEDCVAAVMHRIRALFAGSGTQLEGIIPFGIGDDFTKDRTVAAIVQQVVGVKRLVWHAPAQDVVAIDMDCLATLAALQVDAAEVLL